MTKKDRAIGGYPGRGLGNFSVQTRELMILKNQEGSILRRSEEKGEIKDKTSTEGGEEGKLTSGERFISCNDRIECWGGENGLHRSKKRNAGGIEGGEGNAHPVNLATGGVIIYSRELN